MSEDAKFTEASKEKNKICCDGNWLTGKAGFVESCQASRGINIYTLSFFFDRAARCVTCDQTVPQYLNLLPWYIHF